MSYVACLALDNGSCPTAHLGIPELGQVLPNDHGDLCCHQVDISMEYAGLLPLSSLDGNDQLGMGHEGVGCL